MAPSAGGHKLQLTGRGVCRNVAGARCAVLFEIHGHRHHHRRRTGEPVISVEQELPPPDPRQLSFEQSESLRRLSHQVLAQLELRRRLIEYSQTIRELEQARLEASAEKGRAEEMLRNGLPAPIVDELKRNGRVQPKYTRSSTILFADIQGFTLLAERTEPARLINLLDEYFTALDEIGARYGLEKVKTMGDAYMAVAGVLSPNRRHSIDVCLAALEIRTYLAHLKARCERIEENALQLRIGIHIGPVISGVVGNRRMTFEIWDDAVNTAWFMKAFGVAGRINVSETVAGHVRGVVRIGAARPHRGHARTRA